MISEDFVRASKLCLDLVSNGGRTLRAKFVLLLVMDVATVAFSVGAPWVLKSLIDSFQLQAPKSTLAWLGVAYGLTWLAAELLLGVRAIVGSVVIEGLKKQASLRFCVNSIFKSKPKVSDLSGGVFATKLNQIDYAIPVFVDGVVSQVLPLAVRFLLSIGILMQLVPPVYSVVLTVVVFTFALVSYLTFRIIGDRQRVANYSVQSAFGVILDLLNNRETIIAHAEENREISNLDNCLKIAKNAKVRTTITEQVIGGGQITLLGLGLTLITAMSAVDLSKGMISVGEFVQINSYLLQFVLPVSYFGMVISGIKRASVTLGENAPFLYGSGGDFCEIKMQSRSIDPPSISFKNVNVHDESGQSILKNISFEISGGSSVAIIGASGAGKTTLIKSLVGLCDIESGEVLVNSRPISFSGEENFRHILGYVPQGGGLLDRTVKDNIYTESSPGKEDALRFYHKSGMPPLLEEDGREKMTANLSGGEKQRVSLARAIARGSAIMVLDEPTSSLDANSKNIIADYVFSSLTANVTRVIVTHDLHEAKRADKIVVLVDGAATEIGRHDELIVSCGWYQQQWAEYRDSRQIGDVNK